MLTTEDVPIEPLHVMLNRGIDPVGTSQPAPGPSTWPASENLATASRSMGLVREQMDMRLQENAR